MQTDNTRGFTLIELMIVVAIIAILAAIAIPTYLNYVLRSKVRVAQADVLTLSSAVENYRQRTLTYPASASSAEQGWAPGSNANNFTFAYAPTAGNVGYTITATAQAAMGKVSGCTLSVTDGNSRTIGAACNSVGVTDWP